MSRSRREEGRETRSHGDLGFVGERFRDTNAYGNNAAGNSVDAMLTSSDCVPSNIETMKYAMKSYGPEGRDLSDMPSGPNPKQSGPYFGDVHAKDGTPDKDNRPYRMEYSTKMDKPHKADRTYRRESGRTKLAAGGIGKTRKDQY